MISEYAIPRKLGVDHLHVAPWHGAKGPNLEMRCVRYLRGRIRISVHDVYGLTAESKAICYHHRSEDAASQERLSLLPPGCMSTADAEMPVPAL